MTEYPEMFSALAADFDKGEVKWRPQGGKSVPYITGRTVQNRLDNVLGPCGWWDDYEVHEHSAICRLTIRLPDGTTVTKQDAGGAAGMQDEGDDAKSIISDAFKRAAVKFGVGRLLYGDGSATFQPPALKQATPEPARPPATRDDRSFWQLASDGAGKFNDRFRAHFGNPDLPNITDAGRIASLLLTHAVKDKRSSIASVPLKTAEVVHHMEEVYGNHRSWVLAELKRVLNETYDEAVREASAVPTEASEA